jgi:hypothetical protein
MKATQTWLSRQKARSRSDRGTRFRIVLKSPWTSLEIWTRKTRTRSRMSRLRFMFMRNSRRYGQRRRHLQNPYKCHNLVLQMFGLEMCLKCRPTRSMRTRSRERRRSRRLNIRRSKGCRWIAQRRPIRCSQPRLAWRVVHLRSLCFRTRRRYSTTYLHSRRKW